MLATTEPLGLQRSAVRPSVYFGGSSCVQEYRAKSTDNRVLTDNKTLFCHFERRREISELRPQVRLTLRLLSCILFVVVLSCSFGAQKNEKARHTGARVASVSARELLWEAI